MKQKINVTDPKTGKARVACLDVETEKAHFSDGREYSMSYLKKKTKGGIGFFEIFRRGKLVQKSGKYGKSN